MSQIIIVGVDESTTAKRAAESAHVLATALNAPLHVVSAFDVDRTEVVGSGSERVTVTSFDEAEHVARTVAESLGQNVEVTYSAARGRPADAIIKEALRLEARIIVVGNRRMHGIGRILGSVANSVAHNAHCDVYIANTYDVD
jgi:nucleotide-binding universal stress UspA family protein